MELGTESRSDQVSTADRNLLTCRDFRVSDLGRSPSRAKTKQPKEEGEGQCFARPSPDDAGMRRFAAGRVSDGTRTRDRLDHNLCAPHVPSRFTAW
jgi:hypothetical protein